MLLPPTVLVRRADCLAVIAQAFELAATGLGFRTIAKRLGAPPETVRGWLRRGRANAGVLVARAVAWAAWMDTAVTAEAFTATASPLVAVVDAVGVLGAAAARRGGTAVRATSSWALVAVITRGQLLGPRLVPG